MSHIYGDLWTVIYATGRKYRVATGRTLKMQASATALQYNIAYDCTTCSGSFHGTTTLTDPNGYAQRVWYFQTDGSRADAGLLTRFRTLPQLNAAGTGSRQFDYTWATSPSGNLYINVTSDTSDLNSTAQTTAVTTDTVDQYGNVTRRVIADYSATASPTRTYTYTYVADANYISRHMTGLLSSATVTDGTYTSTLVSNTYDSCNPADFSGNPLALHDPAYQTYANYRYRGNICSSTTPTSTTNYGYSSDMTGMVIATITNGVSSSATLDSTTFSVPTQITTNTLTTTLGYTSNLQPQQATGANGESSSVFYTAIGRPDHTTGPNGATTTYAYNDAASPPTSTATTNGRWTRTSFDGFGRTIKVETGDGGGTKSIVDTQYASCGCSPLGKLSKVSMPYAPGGTPVWTVYEYDGMGRTTKVTAPDGSATTYAYSGVAVTVTDPRSKWKTFWTDAFGNLVKVTEPDPSLGDVNTTYAYDILNHLKLVTMPRGSNTQTRTFNYVNGTTVEGRLRSATNPENGTVSYTYDANGRLSTRTDAAGTVASYTYDSLGGVYQVKYNGTVAATYNRGSAQSGDNAVGRVSSVSYNAGPYQTVEQYQYTPAGQLNGKTISLTGIFHIFWNGIDYYPTLSTTTYGSWTYDNEGRMLTATAPGGRQYSWAYNTMGQPLKLDARNTGQADYSPVVTNATYGPAGEPLDVFYPWRPTSSRSYNSRLQLISMDGVSFSYGDDGSNNGQIQTETRSGETIVYQYDSLKRLTLAQSDSPAVGYQVYTCDAFGNLTDRAGNGGVAFHLSVDKNTNRVLGVPYNANGAMTSVNGYALTYDSENRMIRAYKTDDSLTFGYAPNNQRVYQKTATTVNNVTTTTEKLWFWGPNGKVMASCGLQLSTDNGWSFDVVNCDADSWVEFGGRRQGQDRLGSTGARHYPYGDQQPGGTGSFATYERESRTGIDYAVNRWYSSAYGRFTTPDPYRTSSGQLTPGSWNRYSYVQDDPISFYDPRGTNAEIPGYCPAEYPYCPWWDGGSGVGGGATEPIPYSCDLFGGCWTPSYAPDPPVKPAHTAPEPECNVTLLTQEVHPGGNYTPYQHTSIKLEIRIEGQIVATEHVDGRNVEGYLSAKKGTDAYFKDTPQTAIWSSGFSTTECETLWLIVDAVNTFPERKFRYGVVEQNSNSLTHALLYTKTSAGPWYWNLVFSWSGLVPGWLWPLNW